MTDELQSRTGASLSLTVAFQNPTGGPALNPAGAGVKLGVKGREKLGVPYIAVDGVEHPGDWTAPTRLDITPGSHRVEVYFKLKGIPLKRAKGKADFTASQGEVTVRAHFGQYLTTTEVNVPGQPPIRKKRMIL
jgi:hypothetical protein